MCGILGGLNCDFDHQHLARLRHRGPDQCALESRTDPKFGTIQIGQTRLNVIDRRDVTIPIKRGPATIVFNGQIYNHLDLRAELKTLNWEFTTETDMEVALVAYLQWGPDCLQHFNGMFALAIWDGKQFFCARDRMGMKPFYYRHYPGQFAFASEIKVFDELRLIQDDAFDLLEFVFDDRTLYRDICALKPAHYLIYDAQDDTWQTRCYWDVRDRFASPITNPRTAVDEFIDLLTDAVRLRTRADVEVAMFLSGGIDSSLIAALAGIGESFTCQFDELRRDIDEESYVRDLLTHLDMRANIVRPTRHQFFEHMTTLAYHLEIPTGSFSVFPLYMLARAAHQRGYKAVLSGEGADELFAGYARTGFLMDDVRSACDRRSQHYASMLERFDGSHFDRFCRMASRTGLAGAAMLKSFLAPHWDSRRTALDNICYIESKIFLQPLLQMSDRMSMAQSVEARCPFLDHRIVEFAFSLDDSIRLRDGVGKWIVHEAAKRILPASAAVLQRTVKDGLAAPINQWLFGQHGFDRRYWNTLLTAECTKALLSKANVSSGPRPRPLDVRTILSAGQSAAPALTRRAAEPTPTY